MRFTVEQRAFADAVHRRRAILQQPAELKVTEVAKHTALEAMQMMGGYGYAREYGMQGQVRRASAPPIHGGANEIQREIIGKGPGL